MDVNATVAGWLHDLAAVQTHPEKRRAYGRAAGAIFALDDPLDVLAGAAGTLPKIPAVGPSSTRVIMEVLGGGASPTVERAIAGSGRTAEVGRARQLRAHFFSRAEALRVLKERRGTRRADPAAIRGDLQVHSGWSDGAASLDELAEAGMARGYACLGITDHSPGQRIPRGMSRDDTSRRRAELARVNAACAGRFRLLDGVEANILEDGALDLAADEVRAFELVLAAPHSGLRRPEDQTARLLRAVGTPGVHVLAHPRGRLFGARAGIAADWPRVFAAAARAGVAVEIDGDPARQDLDYDLAREALSAGCLFALDSDAHAIDELWYTDLSRAHAAVAGIPADRIINGWPLEQLLDWLGARRAGPARRYAPGALHVSKRARRSRMKSRTSGSE
jgi:histidinol phosphatase-like PHP family hydrolase